MSKLSEEMHHLGDEMHHVSEELRKPGTVFIVSLIIALGFILWGTLDHDGLDTLTKAVQGFIVAKFGWFYMLSATAFLIFALILAVSKHGDLKLGQPDDEPEFSTLTWYAMLFSAGMGIGLVFWGVAEPLYHFNGPPEGQPGTPEAGREALRYAFFHWGLHPWACYSVIALALAFFGFRKGYPGTISQVFRPLIGDRVDGPIGHAINILAVFATIFGVATSLGFGAAQITGGLSYLFSAIPNNITTQLVVIGIVTVLYMASAQTGLERGIKWLSNANVVLAMSLMLFMLFAGPTNFIMDAFTTTLGSYLQFLPTMSFNLSPFQQGSTWAQNWTVFYWAWWIAWAPFVGSFIARVSKGRTIREFVIGVLIVPTLFGALWFSVFGGTAIYLDMFHQAGIYQTITDQGIEVTLFHVLELQPGGAILSGLAILLISTFFITSADSATFVLGMQTTDGNMEPQNWVKAVWGLVQSTSAAVLLLAGGLTALQTASIIAAFPFTFVLIAMMFSLSRALRDERELIKAARRASVQPAG